MWIVRTCDCILTPAPAAACVLQHGPSSHRRRSRRSQDVEYERTLAAGAPPCTFPRPGAPGRTDPFGDGLAQPARRPLAQGACGLTDARSAPFAKLPWGSPEPVTCAEAFSCPIHRAPDDGPSLVARLKLPSAASSCSQDVDYERTLAAWGQRACPIEAHDSPWGWPGAAARLEALLHPTSQGARG